MGHSYGLSGGPSVGTDTSQLHGDRSCAPDLNVPGPYRAWHRIDSQLIFLSGISNCSAWVTALAKSSKLVAIKRGRVLLVRRRSDRRWMFPGGRKRARESDRECLNREIKEELPKLKLGRLKLWKEVKKRNHRSGALQSSAEWPDHYPGRLELLFRVTHFETGSGGDTCAHLTH